MYSFTVNGLHCKRPCHSTEGGNKEEDIASRPPEVDCNIGEEKEEENGGTHGGEHLSNCHYREQCTYNTHTSCDKR